MYGGTDPQLTDVTQGDLGDCWLLGPLSAAAGTTTGRQRIKDMISWTGTGFVVSFHHVAPPGNGTSWTVERVEVIPSFPLTRSGTFAYALAATPKPAAEPAMARTNWALWPAVIEKAWAARVGGYDRLTGGREPGAVFEAIFGVRSPATDEQRLGLPLDQISRRRCATSSPTSRSVTLSASPRRPTTSR